MIGRQLDKYEILEEVGQGGMSVVYKGRDTILKREVAVKVLHPHLASHQEARARFEREAQAVAKLRHDNILEIFDYSGKGSTDSYIVTEFIRGRTLKDFVSAHSIAHPEVAAMTVAEICRALAHAHGVGVLHRDIKPENVMVRDDGRLKLMDFGIAQVVDAQRMTVTGQLLGSPAYMSPEHVEGKPLDFRTDLFSVGILLYQLATGELPFKGKNPHEILKKIAECRYLDARVVNPLVGERLGKIIARLLARDPDERYANVGQVQDDLGRYLGEAGLGEPREELARYFAAPVPYEQALRQRLIGALSASGKKELAAKRVSAALELFNRVLTLDPSNEAVLAEIDRLSAKKRALRGVALAAGLVALGGAVWGAQRVFGGGAPGGAVVADAEPAMLGPADAAVPARVRPDASFMVPGPADAAPVADAEPAGGHTPNHRPDAGPREPRADAGGAALVPGAARQVVLTTAPKSAEYRVDGGPWLPVSGGRVVFEVAAGAHVVEVRNPLCKPERFELGADATALQATLDYLPRMVRFVCPQADNISLRNRMVPPSGEVPIEFGRNADSRDLVVTFSGPGGFLVEKQVTIRAGSGVQEVACD